MKEQPQGKFKTRREWRIISFVYISFSGHVEAETKVTVELNTELHGLQKFANYSIRVWAYTRIGDGEKSSPIFCRTDEDGKHGYILLVHLLTIKSL